MNYFFEPVNLKQWDMFQKVKDINHVETFLATKEMKMGDIVLLHVGKQERKRESGVYAWGTIIKAPYILKNCPTDYCNNKNAVDVKIEYISWDAPIIKTSKDKIFQQYRTVHRLSDSTVEKLCRLLPTNFFEISKNNFIMNIENEKLLNELEKYKFNVDEREAITKVRIGQSTYKKLLLQKFNNKCCICKLSNKNLLVGSHIKEWKDSSLKEKGDIDNGLLLCTLHDSLFDKHLISFDIDGRIIFSDELTSEDRRILNLNENIKINISEETEKYMKYHRNKLK